MVRFQRALLLAMCVFCAVPVMSEVIVRVPGVGIGIGPHHRHYRHRRHFHRHYYHHDYHHDGYHN